jgi:hypothetical protein
VLLALPGDVVWAATPHALRGFRAVHGDVVLVAAIVAATM